MTHHRIFLSGLVAALGGCSADDVPQEPTAETDTGEQTSCPTHIRTERVPSLIQTRTGWTGFGHGTDPTAGVPVSYELFDCDEECRVCRLRGPVENAPEEPIQNRRCINEMYPAVCEGDSDCGGAVDSCQFLFQPPTITGDNWSTTYVARLEQSEMSKLGLEFDDGVQGIIDLRTGHVDFEILKTRTMLGFGAVPACVGDPRPGDGLKEGTCEGSSTPCDANSVSTAATTSFDCDWPAPVLPLVFPSSSLSTAGALWHMDESRPMCTAPGVEDQQCWCGTCENDPMKSCAGDDDCPASSCGYAGTGDAPLIVANNACAPGEVCDWDPSTASGTCLDTDGQPRSCMPADGDFHVEGGASVQDGFFISRLASISCVPSVSPELDPALGLPGPTSQQLAIRIDPEYRE